MTIHPKTSGAALGASLGVLLVAVLDSVHGVHLSPELPGAITGFLSILGAFLSPSPDLPALAPPVPPPTPAPAVSVADVLPPAPLAGGGV